MVSQLFPGVFTAHLAPPRPLQNQLPALRQARHLHQRSRVSQRRKRYDFVRAVAAELGARSGEVGTTR